LGAFTVNHDGALLASDQAHGTAGFEEALMRYHGKPVNPPHRPEWTPATGHLDWHGREVFKGEP
jgi:putative restriction endonuclease